MAIIWMAVATAAGVVLLLMAAVLHRRGGRQAYEPNTKLRQAFGDLEAIGWSAEMQMWQAVIRERKPW
jgi:hypothetical protein